MNDKLDSREHPPPAVLLATAAEAARRAGALLRQGFGTSFAISSKEGKHNLVTEYDNAAEKAIIDCIAEAFPGHTFLAEESGATGTAADSAVQWIVDPLDGTVNFAHNIPIFSVSIAAALHGEVLCGVIYQPLLEEMFTTARGHGAWLNGKRLHVSSAATLETSLLVTGFPYDVHTNPYNTIGHFSRIVGMGIPVRRLGSAALDLAYVAAGRFDGFWEVKLNPWDMAAGWLLVEEAGGRATHYNGSTRLFDDGTIIATNGTALHDELAALLAMP